MYKHSTKVLLLSYLYYALFYFLKVLHTLANWELFPNVSVAYIYHHQGMVAVCY